METPLTRSGETFAMNTTAHNETLGDVVMTLAAMGGALGGAVGGAMLGAEVGSLFPEVFGTLGTVLGSGLAASVGWVLTCFWTGSHLHTHTHQNHENAAKPARVDSAPTHG